jgi:hypothetical protein
MRADEYSMLKHSRALTKDPQISDGSRRSLQWLVDYAAVRKTTWCWHGSPSFLIWILVICRCSERFCYTTDSFCRKCYSYCDQQGIGRGVVWRCSRYPESLRLCGHIWNC